MDKGLKLKELKEKVSNLKVLFVDDEEDIRKSTGVFFKKFFNNVLICENGEDGLNTFKENQDIDIVLSDIKMPKLDGISMAYEIKKIKPSVLIVFISASRGEHQIADDFEHIYITKPITYETIIKFLEELEVK